MPETVKAEVERMISTIKRVLGVDTSGKNVRINAAGLSDVGKVREANEDRFCILAGPDILGPAQALFVVADGMGGHVGGQVASEIAALTVQRGFEVCRDSARTRPVSTLEHLRRTVADANTRIIDHAVEHPELSGMGSTLTALAVAEGEFLVAHVGDSRAYLIESSRDGSRIYPLTKDHSWVAAQVELGLLTPAEAREHPRRSMITRALGLERGMKVDTRSMPLPRKSVILICSDGLYDLVEDHEMADAVGSARTPEQACRKLVRIANERGGHDNITVIVAAVTKQ